MVDISIADYKSVLAPFLMMASCATLVWALQLRYSRIVQAIRTLRHEGQRENIRVSGSIEKQIAWLAKRSALLRNSIVEFYFAMGFFLTSSSLLALAVVFELPLFALSIAAFLLGLIIICCALTTAVMETLRSYAALEEETSA